MEKKLDTYTTNFQCPNKKIEGGYAHFNRDDDSIFFSPSGDAEEEEISAKAAFRVAKALLNFLKVEFQSDLNLKEMLNLSDRRDQSCYYFCLNPRESVEVRAKLNLDLVDLTIMFPKEEMAQEFYDSLN